MHGVADHGLADACACGGAQRCHRYRLHKRAVLVEPSSYLCCVLLTQVEVESYFTSSGELTTLYYYKYWIGLNSISWPAFG